MISYVHGFILVFLAGSTVLFFSCTDSDPDENPDENNNPLSGEYFNLTVPSTVTRFAPDVFTEELHAPPIFTPNGDEVYWSLMSGNNIFCKKLVDGSWSETEVTSFSLNGGGDSPFISPDGTKLLFLSWRNSSRENIWLAEKNNNEWGSLTQLSDDMNHGAHWQASMSEIQNIYFGSQGDIYFSEYRNGNYTIAQKMDSLFNTESGHEGSPFIAPDESYLIFDRGDPYADLFISFKESDDSWGIPVPMTALNTTAYHELYANVSPDGRFIMFLSGRAGGELFPFWIDASIIDTYRHD